MKIENYIPFLASILALVVIVGVVSFGGVSLTGNANAASTVRECYDTDEIDNRYFAGKVTAKDNFGSEKVYKDECTSSNRNVKQFRCTQNGKFTSSISSCAKGCVEGACII